MACLGGKNRRLWGLKGVLWFYSPFCCFWGCMCWYTRFYFLLFINCVVVFLRLRLWVIRLTTGFLRVDYSSFLSAILGDVLHRPSKLFWVPYALL